MDSAMANTSTGRNNKIHPKKLALWMACASMGMLFGAFTSAYIVRQAAGNWLEFQLPNVFFVSTAVIVLSSVLLHLSFLSFKKGNERMYKGLLVAASLMGFAFLALQYQGWLAMEEMGVPLRTNPSGDFIYVISGVHAAHILGGIATLIVALINAFALPFKVTAARVLRFDLTVNYWHFVDLLWVYLMVFFVSQQV